MVSGFPHKIDRLALEDRQGRKFGQSHVNLMVSSSNLRDSLFYLELSRINLNLILLVESIASQKETSFIRPLFIRLFSNVNFWKRTFDPRKCYFYFFAGFRSLFFVNFLNLKK